MLRHGAGRFIRKVGRMMLHQDLLSALEKRQFPIQIPMQWVGGQWIKLDKVQPIKTVYNPSDNAKIADIILDKATVAKAVDVAADARGRIEAMTSDERRDILQRFRHGLSDFGQYIATSLQLGVGKPRWEAEFELQSCIQFLDRLINDSDRIEKELLEPLNLGFLKQDMYSQPIGVVCGFVPFTSPLTTFVQYFTACLVARCPLVVMMSGHAMLTSVLLSSMLQELKLPAGLISVLTGNFTLFQQALNDKRVQAVIYRGSRDHCDVIRQENRALGRQLLLTSGGKNSAIVLESADLEVAAKCLLSGAFRGAGQLCSATSRAFIPRSRWAEFKPLLMEKLQQLKVGPTDDPQQNPHMGPLYSSKAIEKFLRFQTMAKREAIETLQWGRLWQKEHRGNLVLPGVHLLEKVDATKAYQSNVFMCPDLALYCYDEIATAIEGANATDAPLVNAIIGRESDVSAIRGNLLAPNITVNLPTSELDIGFAVSGRMHCGHLRLAGMGLAFYLTYPQAVAQGQAFQDLFKTWP